MPKFAANLTMLFGEMPVMDRFAAAKAAGFRGVEYLFPYDFEKAELHAVVHVEAALRLANEAEVRVVHHHVQVGQLELRAHGQLLDHELEVVVARQCHDSPRRVGGAHTCLLYTSPSPRDLSTSRMPSSA